MVETELFDTNFSVTHVLNVVPNQFNIPVDGILGKDFFKQYRCNLNYDDMTLSFWLNGQFILIPIITGPTDDVIVLPARSEVIREFQLSNIFSPHLVEPQELTAGVFVARTIIDSNKPLVRVINTTDDIKLVNRNKLITEDLSNYTAQSFEKVENTPERTSLLTNIIKQNTPHYAHEKLLPLCTEFADIFALESDRMTVNNFYTQKLRIKDNDPVYIKNYRLPYNQKSEVYSQVEKLLANDFIEPSTSNFNSPIILVPKPAMNGTKRWRMCLDYRQVNKKLIADRFPLPRIDDILDSLGRAKYFSIVDLFQGFHQIPIHADSRDITSFSTDKGSYRWKVLPFGLNISPNSFSRMMAIAFTGITPEQAFLYLDDIIIIGHNEEHHLNNIRKVFEIMRKFNLKLHPNKCNFFKPEVTFLGHKCTPNGLFPDDKKKVVIENYPIPQDKNSTRRFVAFANYYRRFISNFSVIAQPLNRLTRKNTSFEWTDECQRAFDILRKKLMNPPILKYPDFTKTFTVIVDASKIGCGAILTQKYGGLDLPIYYASKTFSKADINKSTPVQECLAIHFALTQFRPYIYGKPFIVRSDHKSLIYLFSHKNPSPKLTRIRLELEDYDFTIEHIKGRDNVTADALSRISIDDLKDLYGKTAVVLPVQTRLMTKKMRKTISQSPDWNQIPTMTQEEVKVVEDLNANFNTSIPRVNCIRTYLADKHEFLIKLYTFKCHKKLFHITLQVKDMNDEKFYEILLAKLEQELIMHDVHKIQWPMNDIIFEYITINKFKQICDANLKQLQIILIKRPLPIYDDNEKQKLMSDYHDNYLFGGHCGHKRLYSKLRSKYYWKNMSREIATFVRNCEKCQHTKVKPRNKEPLFLTPTPQKPFDTLILDTIGPLPTSDQGNKYAVTMICDLSKYLIIAPIPDKEAPTVAKAIFTNFVLTYGLPRQIRTDLGSEYVNKVFTELTSLLDISHNTSTPHHHQTVGTVERNHRVLNEYIRTYISENLNDWENYSKYFAFCYNITNNSSLDHKYSPFELVFNKKPVFPEDLLKNEVDPVYNIDNFVKEARYRLQTAHMHARSLIEKMKLRNKLYHDKTVKPLRINIGEKVLVEREPYDKHKPIYSGPYVVKNIPYPNLVLLDEKNNKLKIIHMNRIRNYNK